MTEIIRAVAFVLAVLVAFSWLFTVFDAISVPVEVWRLARRRKGVWLFLILFFGLFGMITYWSSVRPDLRRTA